MNPPPALSNADAPVRPQGPRRRAVLIFDVNETLSDMSPMRDRFEDVGAAAHLATTWFAELLRDGFAPTAARSSAASPRIAAEALRVSLHDVPLNRAAETSSSTSCTGSPDPRDVVVVAVHPWDSDGAARTGWATTWINRTRGLYPAYFTAPDLRPGFLVDIAPTSDEPPPSPASAGPAVG